MRYYLLAKKLSEEDRREHQHLEAAALEHLLAADRTAKQTEQLFHVLAVCPHCREVGGWLLELHQANALPPVFGLIDAALARSRAEAHQLWQELVSLDPEARLSHLQADSRFVSWGLCELLVQESRRAAPENASEAVHLADLAVHMADMIAEGEPFEEKWIYQLRSLAWAALGNAYKVQVDLAGAERSFEMSTVPGEGSSLRPALPLTWPSSAPDAHRAPPAALRRHQLKSPLAEVSVEGEGPREPALPHHFEARAVDEA